MYNHATKPSTLLKLVFKSGVFCFIRGRWGVAAQSSHCKPSGAWTKALQFFFYFFFPTFDFNISKTNCLQGMKLAGKK